MKGVKCKDLKTFNDLNSRIYDAVKTKLAIGTTTWAKPDIKNSITNEILCPVETDTERGLLMMAVIKEIISDILLTDITWFPNPLANAKNYLPYKYFYTVQTSQTADTVGDERIYAENNQLVKETCKTAGITKGSGIWN